MRHTHTIETTSTVMRGTVCVLQLDVKVEVDVEDGTNITVVSFDLGESVYVIKKMDHCLFTVLLEGIDKRKLFDRVIALYNWQHDNETGFMTCTGLAA